MSSSENAVVRLGKAYNRHDLDALAGCFTRSAVLVAPDGIGQDRDEISSYYAQFMEAFPDSIVIPLSMAQSGDTLVAEYTITGSHKGPYLAAGGEVAEATGRPIAVRACCWTVVEDDGLIASHRIFYDQLELAAQIGGHLRFDGTG
jgi:hypothetical protein